MNDKIPDDFLMTFGKHSGQKIGNVDPGYLLWFMDQPWAPSDRTEEYLYCIQNNDLLLQEYEEQYDRPWCSR